MWDAGNDGIWLEKDSLIVSVDNHVNRSYHSIVIHDDKAPVHRGNRMACTAILRQYRHKVIAVPSTNS